MWSGRGLFRINWDNRLCFTTSAERWASWMHWERSGVTKRSDAKRRRIFLQNIRRKIRHIWRKIWFCHFFLANICFVQFHYCKAKNNCTKSTKRQGSHTSFKNIIDTRIKEICTTFSLNLVKPPMCRIAKLSVLDQIAYMIEPVMLSEIYTRYIPRILKLGDPVRSRIAIEKQRHTDFGLHGCLMLSPKRGGATGHRSAQASPEPSGRRLQSRATDIRVGGRGGVAPPPLTPMSAAAGPSHRRLRRRGRRSS
jgi:hypothetical protein